MSRTINSEEKSLDTFYLKYVFVFPLLFFLFSLDCYTKINMISYGAQEPLRH